MFAIKFEAVLGTWHVFGLKGSELEENKTLSQNVIAVVCKYAVDLSVAKELQLTFLVFGAHPPIRHVFWGEGISY